MAYSDFLANSVFKQYDSNAQEGGEGIDDILPEEVKAAEDDDE